MDDDLRLDLLTLGSQGYCCSQIVIILGLRLLGRDNPDLVRAMTGPCHGVGGCGEVCGALTGGACFIALHAGKGADREVRDDRYPLMVEELTGWFRDEACAACGGVRCSDILGEGVCAIDPARCGALVAEVFQKCVEILLANDLDPAEGRPETT